MMLLLALNLMTVSYWFIPIIFILGILAIVRTIIDLTHGEEW